MKTFFSMKKLATGSVFVALGSLQIAMADPTSVNPRPRSLGMGATGVALSGDHDSASANPAALNDVTKRNIQILPILMEVPFSVSLLNNTLDLNDKLDKATSEEEKRTALEEYMRDVGSMATSTRVNLYPSWTQKNFHVGILADFYVNPRFRVSGLPANEVVELGGSAGTAGLVVGGAYSFLKDRLSVGMVLKPLYRVAVTPNQEQTAYDVLKGRDPGFKISDQIFGSEKAGVKGFGFGVDLGVQYKLPTYFEFQPTVGITYQDIGDTRFFGDTTPASIKQSISVGFALQRQFAFTQNTFAFDLRNLNEEQDFLNKVHFGVESVIWKILAVRAGLSQLYWTAGLGLQVPFFDMDFYVAAREAGRFAHIQDDRVLGLKLAFKI